jgi:hypothetical protein
MSAGARTAVVFAAASLATGLTAAPALAQVPERFSGTLSFAKSAFAKAARREPFTLDVAGEIARYRHTVLNEDGTAGVGTEAGEGPVGSDGRVTLAGAWKSPTGVYSYAARYSGTLTSKGGQLAGNQAWKMDGRSGERSCTITLSKRRRGLIG